MDVISTLRAIFALAIVLGLILGLAYGLRRYAPQLMARMQAQRGERRMKVIETLVLDPARRLVLVSLDNEERLILLGDGRELAAPTTPAPTTPAPKPLASAPTVANRKPAKLSVSAPGSQDDDLF